jgi:YHS domain-containing protein
MAKTCSNQWDPVCGMLLENLEAEYTEDFEGNTYGFCCQWCKDSFHGNPRRYIEMPGSHKGMPTPKDVPEKH